MKIANVAIVGFLILSLTMPQVFAESQVKNCKLGGCTEAELAAFLDFPLIISTDNDSYSAGDAIKISGILQQNITPGYQVALMVISPIGNVVSIAQISPDSNNEFTSTIQSGDGGLWKESGTYTIEAKYNNMEADATFDFDSGIIKETPSITTGASVEEEDITVIVDGEIFSVKYSIENGTVAAAYIDIETKSLIIVIDSLDDGVVTLTLPNSLIMSDEYGYFILLDGEEANNYDESTTSSSTTLIIPFGAGTEQIEIIGSWVVPEFGAIAGLVLAVAIISIIVLSAKTRLNVIPKI
jgi:predicted secreted protein with PEFG-CTERM motif